MGSGQWLDEFIQYLTIERHYSDLTCNAYRGDLVGFRSFLTAVNENSDWTWKTITAVEVENYLDYLTQQKDSSRTIARKISALRSFFRFLKRQQLVKQDPCELVQLKTHTHILPEFLYEEELAQLLAATGGSSPLQQRNRALVELLYGTGIRVSEASNLTLHQIDFGMKVILIHGKGNKDRYVPLGTKAHQALNVYLQEGRQQLMGKDAVHDYLFVNSHGRQLTSRGIEYILKQLIKKTKLTANLHPHMLRHSFATQMLNNGADLRTAQNYTHLTMEHLQSDYRKYFPRATNENEVKK
ncbi:tyrosine-type recombinase/integrase [Bombilactobacillus bombi]|uniref:tyrosine-type recombinase/integrase n=1 Tax=Bombilactobacillus bombi TaxID=1303590 RepID=UPI002159E82F|nr:tyrosine-type recombinase/integrase [Bombilactobacillus bombi]